MTSFHYSAKVRYNLDPLGRGKNCPVRRKPNYTVLASVFEVEVVRLMPVSKITKLVYSNTLRNSQGGCQSELPRPNLIRGIGR